MRELAEWCAELVRFVLLVWAALLCAMVLGVVCFLLLALGPIGWVGLIVVVAVTCAAVAGELTS